MKGRILLLALLVCVFCCTAFCAEPSDIEEQAAFALHEAEKLLQMGQSAEALAAFDQLLVQYPDCGSEKWVELRKMESLYHLARYDEAIALGRSLVERYSQSDPLLASWAQCQIGTCFMGKQDWQTAVTQLQMVENMNAADLYDRAPAQSARVRLAEIYLHLQKGQTASANAAEVLKFSKDDQQASASALAMAAAVMAEVGDINAALDCYDRLVKEYPAQSKEIAAAACEICYRWIYRILADAAQDDKADLARLKTLANTPRAVAPEETYYVAKAESALGYYYLFIEKKPEESVRILSGLLTSYPPTSFNIEATYRLACAKRLSGDPSGAAVLFRKTADENPLCGFVAPSLYAAAGCYLSSGQTAEAESVLRKLSAMKGEDDWRQMGMTRLANLLSGGKRYDESILVLSDAKAMLQEKLAVAESSSSPVTASQKGYLREQIGSLDNQVLQLKKLSGRQ